MSFFGVFGGSEIEECLRILKPLFSTSKTFSSRLSFIGRRAQFKKARVRHA